MIRGIYYFFQREDRNMENSWIVEEKYRRKGKKKLPRRRKTRPRSPWHVGPLWDLTIGP